MKQNILILLYMILGLCCICGQSLAVCPEAPNDNGLCDSLNAGVFPIDQWIDFSAPSPHLVRLSFYLTHDNIYPVDSIAGMVLPMCYTHTNPAKYCSLTAYWNNLYDFSNPRNIFRHLVMDGDTIHNWMMERFEVGHGEEWNGIILDLDGISKVGLCLIPSGSEDQRIGDVNHVLLATMTFRLEDTTTICVDTCFWPPDAIGLRFCRSDAVTYLAQDNMTYCVNIRNEIRGDANGDQVINITDVIFIMNYLFRHGLPPVSFISGDANCDNDLGILDVVYLINYLYKEGAPPGC